LAIAKQFFDAHQYAKAVQAAKRAESIAMQLDERFGQYPKAMQGLQPQIGSMKRLGLDTEAIAKVAGTAEEKVVAGISENGAFVPNYLEARDILVRATQEGRAFQEKSEIASNRIFVAELAIESLANLKGSADSGAFAHGAASNLEQTIHVATKELALGNPGTAAEILYGRLQREGFHSYAADAALRDARRTIREGSYDRAIEHLERALQAFARRTNARAALGKDIEETRTRVRLLAGSGLSFLP